jgi:site-specific recombinase XerD
MLGKFLRHCERVKADYRTVNRRFIEQYLLSLPIVRDHRREIVTALRGFYDFLGVDPNPELEIALPRPTRNRLPRKVPAVAEINRIAVDVGGITEELELRNRLLIELAYGSGLRRGELRGLDVGDIDLHAKTAFVTGKGNRSRNVPLTDRSVELLREYLSLRHVSRGPLLASLQGGRRLTVGHISKLFHRMTGYNTHAFRHACATHMLKEGCNLRFIQELLGHGKITTTELYTQLDKQSLAAVVEKIHPRNRSAIKNP